MAQIWPFRAKNVSDLNSYLLFGSRFQARNWLFHNYFATNKPTGLELFCMTKSVKVSFAPGQKPEFFGALRQRVNLYFEQTQKPKQGDASLYWKTALLYTLYLGSFALILFSGLPGWVLLLLCVPMGLGACGLGLNVMHDALHQSFTPNKTWNKIVGFTMELLGGSNVTWKIQHNLMHHTFTNVYGMDEDVDDKVMLRLSPDGVWKPYHRFQHIYAPLLYGLSNVSWLVQKDFVQFIRYWKDGTLQKTGVEPKSAFASLVVAKALYFGLIMGLPMLLLPFAWYWSVLGFVIVQCVSGLIMTLVFLTAHAVQGPHHFQPNEHGSLENNWAIHQLMTTANFGAGNPIVNWFVGGLNHQIEHHLFPNISHVHYAALSPIVREVAAEHGLAYFEYPSFGQAVVAHFQYLKQVGARA
jgi:linoleoyl-CoA desaturase